jgi:[ribosomal protein S5]-alanine N-acetyltransferase
MFPQTPRLTLREVTLEDAPFVLELLNSPGWLEFIGDRGVRTLEAAQTYIRERFMSSYQTNGYGLYLVALKADHTPIGLCGLVRRDTLPGPDIGFAFLPAYAGQGYGYEAASATLHFAQTTLQLPRLLAITDPKNQKSIRLLEKIGLQFEDRIIVSGEELLLFARK